MSKTSTLLAGLTGAALVAAHGHVSHIVVNGVSYENYDPTSYFYQPNPPTVIGWATTQQDNGFVEPNNVGTSDIICHRSGAPGGGHATVAAGDKISIVWDPEWPESHIGPVIDYLAACDGDCESVSKESLKFFKIDGAGYDKTAGRWAADALRANGNSWLVQIPSDLKAGNYVLRHEIIALHGGGSPNGTQAYPQCINLRVTGSGSALPAGVPGPSLYTASDAGILFNPYVPSPNYPVPGPALIAGAASSIAQSKSVATATASATVPGGGGANPNPTPASSTPAAGTPVPGTTLRTSTSTAAAQTTPPPTGGSSAQTKYGQCGGSGWAGPTACAAGSSCTVLNDWYAQCV
ncbi:glycosyl hydrolase family 61-domain-containing protein [Parachaetomium inaequale]|uniref:lytic cellulose monooxygenase (C4-dehydrogenating) n=1 Tax=Parachaetomium inaequale TaxID=2588326 RepID=A0AAN6SRK8_9PEZI|nr:glycosyl hydrolase family 61-domain-containing protein [Parachaetomium inaequale]